MSIVGLRKWVHKGNIFRWIMGILAAVLAFGIAWMGLGGGVGSKNSPGHGESAVSVIATVNGKPIDSAVFEGRYQDYLAQQSGSISGVDDSRLNEAELRLGVFQVEYVRWQVLNEIVNEKLTAKAAEQAGLSVSGRELSTEVEKTVDADMKQIRYRILGDYKGKDIDNAFSLAWDRTHPGETLDMLKTNVEKKVDASTDQIQDGLLGKKLIDKMTAGIDTSEQALKASYDEVGYRQITIGTGKRSQVQAESRAKEIAELLKNGGSFAQLAKEDSDDPLKNKGGFQEPIPLSSIRDKAISDAFSRMKPGDLSAPLKTQAGFVIVKLESKQSRLPKDFDDPKKHKTYKDQFENMAKSKVQQDIYMGIQKTGKVEYLDPEMKACSILFQFSGGDPKSTMIKAIAEFKKALTGAKEARTLSRIYAQLAMLNQQMSSPAMSPKKEDQDKYRKAEKDAIDSALESTESPELRLMLADLLIKGKQYDEAVKQLSLVSDNSYNDPNTHRQILAKYMQMSKDGYTEADKLIAAENKWLSEEAQREKEQAAAMAQPVSKPAAKPGAAKTHK